MNDQMTYNSFKQTKSQPEINKTFLSALQHILAIMLHLSFISSVWLRKACHTQGQSLSHHCCAGVRKQLAYSFNAIPPSRGRDSVVQMKNTYLIWQAYY